jgi:hypothetical protein
MAGSWIGERIGQVLELTDALIKRELPDGVGYKEAQLRQAQLKVELYERMLAERLGDPEVETQLIAAQRQLTELPQRLRRLLTIDDSSAESGVLGQGGRSMVRSMRPSMSLATRPSILGPA